MAVSVASNAVLALGRRRLADPRSLCGGALTLDTLLLTALLLATGGASNPFSVLYLVYIALAAVVLRARWTWFLAGLSVVCYGLLFAAGRGSSAHATHGGDDLGAHLQGMWVAFTVAAVAHRVLRGQALRRPRAARGGDRRDAGARRAPRAAGGGDDARGGRGARARHAARHDRGRQPGARAGGRSLPEAQGRALIEDASLIRSELERCRAILSQLAADSGDRPGEAPEAVDVAQVVAAIVRGVPPAHRDRLRVEVPKPRPRPERSARRARAGVASLLQNALEAGGGPVTLSVAATAAKLLVRVEDQGSGMTPEVLARVGEPFFSTKPPGQGMGLGLFLARTLGEQMGGRLDLESQPGTGTTATVDIGAPALEARSALDGA